MVLDVKHMFHTERWMQSTSYSRLKVGTNNFTNRAWQRWTYMTFYFLSLGSGAVRWISCKGGVCYSWVEAIKRRGIILMTRRHCTRKYVSQFLRRAVPWKTELRSESKSLIGEMKLMTTDALQGWAKESTVTRRGIPAKRGLFLKCSKCKEGYDIAQLTREAEAKQKRNLYCPHCGQRIGQLQ